MSLESDQPERPGSRGPESSGPESSGPESRGPESRGPESRGPESSGQQPQSGGRFRLLDDPVAIRALAHPLRLDLLSITGHAGQITTADAARELGISHGLASHHLRQLAKYGFVRQSAGKDNRERPWRLTATSMSWRDSAATTEGAAAAAVFEEVLAERAAANLRSWLRRRSDWPAGWRQHTGVSQSTVYLTLAELAGLETAIDALIKRYVDERPLDDVASRPEGSVPVDIYQIITVPLERPPEDS
jgi:DNA-binding transcriptional ArsR family regulator